MHLAQQDCTAPVTCAVAASCAGKGPSSCLTIQSSPLSLQLRDEGAKERRRASFSLLLAKFLRLKFHALQKHPICAASPINQSGRCAPPCATMLTSMVHVSLQPLQPVQIPCKLPPAVSRHHAGSVAGTT